MLETLHHQNSALPEQSAPALSDPDSLIVQQAKYRRVAENFAQYLDRIIDYSQVSHHSSGESDLSTSNDILISARQWAASTNSKKLNKTSESLAVDEESGSSRQEIDNGENSKLHSYIDA